MTNESVGVQPIAAEQGPSAATGDRAGGEPDTKVPDTSAPDDTRPAATPLPAPALMPAPAPAPGPVRGDNQPQHPGWLDRALAEVVRGRHLILHGNIHDHVYWRGEYLPVTQVLLDALSRLGYSTIGVYDQIDGLRVLADESLRRFSQLSAEPQPESERGGDQAGVGRGPAGGSQATQTAPATPGRSGGGRIAAIDQALGRAVDLAEAPRYDRPQAAVAAIRRALAQDREPSAFILDLADLLLLDPEHHEQNDRQLLGAVKKAMLGAAQIGVRHNVLILVVGDLASVPEWLYRNEPFVQPVEVLRPTAQEREAYLMRVAEEFHGAESLNAAATEGSIKALAHLSDGMALAELDGLWRTSRRQRIALAEPRELMSRTMFGRRTNPWSALGERAARDASARLGARVLGQPVAVDRVSRALAAATLGIDFTADPHSPEARPKGVFFFVGPTGVGKTELARALSEFVFYDEAAMCRFDMSSFSEPHNAERFYGAPPGYVGHERGGELTNRMHQRPFSVLLFDEVEKAHPSIFDKFLQILEDGRLTDGLGRTAYFSQSLIIFTSNLGADTVYRAGAQGGPLPDYDTVARHFETEVRQHFTATLRRPELLGRLGGGIVPFDIVRPEYIPAIAGKFVAQLTASAARREVRLEIDEGAVVALCQRAMADPVAAGLGYRQVRAVLDHALRAPLVQAIVSGPPRGGFRAQVRDGDEVATITRM